jgi:hypothetical protein
LSTGEPEGLTQDESALLPSADGLKDQAEVAELFDPSKAHLLMEKLVISSQIAIAAGADRGQEHAAVASRQRLERLTKKAYDFDREKRRRKIASQSRSRNRNRRGKHGR